MGYPDIYIWVSGYLDIQLLSRPILLPFIQMLKKLSNPTIQVSDILNIQIAKYPDIKNCRDISNYPRIRILDSWNSFDIKRSTMIMLWTPYLSAFTVSTLYVPISKGTVNLDKKYAGA